MKLIIVILVVNLLFTDGLCKNMFTRQEIPAFQGGKLKMAKGLNLLNKCCPRHYEYVCYFRSVRVLFFLRLRMSRIKTYTLERRPTTGVSN